MNYYDFFIILILILSIIIGFFRGFIKEIISLFFLLFSFFFTERYFFIIEKYLFFINNILFIRFCSFLILFFLIIKIGKIIIFFINKIIKKNRFFIIDHVIGVIFGFFRGVFFIYFMFFLLKNIKFLSNTEYWKSSKLMHKFIFFIDLVLNKYF